MAVSVQKIVCYVFYGCTLFGVVLCHSVHNSVLESHESMVNRQSLRCNNHCPYGFVTDVEGDLTCTCLDPCSYVMCVASECVVEMPKNCQWEPCKPVTKCQERPDITKVRKQDMISPNEGKFLSSYVQDDPDKWWTTTGNSVCSEPLPEAAVTCKNKRKRWFYNSMTGSCQPFDGCNTAGNNFSRKRHCKSRCRRNVVRPEVLRAIVPNDFVCTQPKPNKSECDKQQKRWYFNERTGICEKYFGCAVDDGNSFTRKVFCKATCKNQIAQFRREKRKGLLKGLDKANR